MEATEFQGKIIRDAESEGRGREVVKYMHVYRCLASFRVFVYTHAGTLYSTLQARRWELCQGGTEVVGRKYFHIRLCHSAGEIQTPSSYWNVYIYRCNCVE